MERSELENAKKKMCADTCASRTGSLAKSSCRRKVRLCTAGMEAPIEYEGFLRPKPRHGSKDGKSGDSSKCNEAMLESTPRTVAATFDSVQTELMRL